MLKTIDVGLMVNHLSAHEGVIKRLDLYVKITKNQQLLNILGQQIGTMKNHVQVMNMLLDPNHSKQVTLPPIPQNGFQINTQQSIMEIGLEDKYMALDAHFTATAMANDNFISSTNMKDPHVKHIHVEMAMQQSQIAKQHEMLGEQMGWMTHPNATTNEQQQAINPLNNQSFNPYHQISNNEQAPSRFN